MGGFLKSRTDGDADKMIIDFLSIAPVWTLAAMGGGTAIDFDSFLQMEAKAENSVAYEQLEKGSFAAYNKQASPMEIRCVLASTKAYSLQQDMLEGLDSLCKGTELVSLITPSQEYPNLNLESYNYSRTETGGAALLTVELRLVEIRQVESAATTQVATQEQPKISQGQSKNASNVDIKDTGKTQAKKPHDSLLSKMAKAGA